MLSFDSCKPAFSASSESVREQASYRCAESVCSVFEKTMRINNSVSGFASRQTIEQFHEARLI